MSAFENARLAPSRSTPRASISASLISPPCAPAFMCRAPPIEPGTPRKKASPSTPAFAAALATNWSGAAAPATRRQPSRISIAPNARPPSRMTTPANAAVAHDEIRAEADRRDRRLAREDAQEIGEIVLVRRGEQGLRRAADPKPRRLRDRGVGDEASPQPRRARLQIIDDVGKSHEPASGLVERGKFARQRIGPLGDRAGAEQNDKIAGLGERAHQARELLGRGQHERMAVAVG